MSANETSTALPRESRLALRIQRVISRLLSPISIPIAVGVMRYVYGYRIRNAAQTRKRFQALLKQHRGPLLICANHLTLVDSFIATWAIGSGWWYFANFSKFPWHVPERTNFATTWYDRALIYIAKCVPVVRGAKRGEIAQLLGRLEYLLRIGEPVFIFPEATRSRTGRVQVDSPGHGVGRLLNSVPDCRTLCVYLRGDHQENWGDSPIRGESFYVDIDLVEFKSELRGMRRSQDLAQQTVLYLQKMEEKYLASRGQ